MLESVFGKSSDDKTSLKPQQTTNFDEVERLLLPRGPDYFLLTTSNNKSNRITTAEVFIF